MIRVIFKAGSFGLLSRVLTSLIQFIVMPLIYHNYTESDFNLLIVFLSLNSMVSIGGMGVSKSLINKVSALDLKKDCIKIDRILLDTVNFTVRRLCIVFLIAMLIISVLFATARGNSDVLLMSSLFICNISILVINNIFLDFLRGSQKPDSANQILLISNLCSAFILSILVWTKSSIFGVYFASQIIVNIVVLIRYSTMFNVVFFRTRIQRINNVFCSQTRSFFILVIVQFVGFSSDTIILAFMDSINGAAEYSVAFRFYSLYIFGFSVFSATLWPFFSKNYQRENKKDLIKIVKVLSVVTFAYMSLSYLSLVIISPVFIDRLMEMMVPRIEIFQLLSVQAALVIITSAIIPLLNAMGVLKEQIIWGVCSTSLNIILSIVLITRLGVEGTIISTIISHFFFGVIPFVWIFSKKIKKVFAFE